MYGAVKEESAGLVISLLIGAYASQGFQLGCKAGRQIEEEMRSEVRPSV